MKKYFEKIFVSMLVCMILTTPVFASCKNHLQGQMNTSFSLSEVPEEVCFVTDEDVVSEGTIIIPKNSVVKAKICCCQCERRWHKSGYFICQPISYVFEDSEEIDVSDKDLYFMLRKYEAFDKKEAGKTAAEITATTGASIFLPGIDIIYYFTKGAIQKNKDENRFKSGVSNAYENSIFWFWLKGQPIELSEGDMVKIKDIDKKKAEKLEKKLNKKQDNID